MAQEHFPEQIRTDIARLLPEELLSKAESPITPRGGGGGGGVLGSSFAGYVPLASQNPHPVIVYSVANYRPILDTFGQMSL